MKISEYQIQCAFFQEIRMMANSEPRLKWCHSSLNGIKLPIGLAVKAKKSGMTKGVWDVFLPVRGRWDGFKYVGLYLEFKVAGNNLTPEQQNFKDWLHSEDEECFKFQVCRSAEEGIKAVKQYLNIGA